MNTKTVVSILLLTAAAQVRASAPGTPLDCSDFVFDEPGYSCTLGTLWVPQRGTNLVIDNSGRQLYVLGGGGLFLYQADPTDPARGAVVIGRLEPRQTPTGGYEGVRATLGCVSLGCEVNGGGYPGRLDPPDVIWFDSVNGVLMIPAISYCQDPQCNPGPGDCPPLWCPYRERSEVFLISGFAKLFDILHTYDPVASTISFRSPALPDGLAGADYLDTYWGPLDSVGDWSKAQPLQCRYPDTLPRPGDYLTVPDSLPNPEAGHGYYYVTAATYQGQTRYGRKASGGRLSGRDPALLPACVQPPAR